MYDTIHISQCNHVAAANQHQLRHSNTKNRTYGFGNRWLSHGLFVKSSNEPWGQRNYTYGQNASI